MKNCRGTFACFLAKNFFFSTFLLALCILISIFLKSCASQGAPSGGPKDLAPPKLLGMVPQDQAVNFRGNTVTLVFDEWIDVENIKQNLQITPSLRGDYEHEIRKNVLTLTFKEPFESNTTYTFNFGDALRDVTEKNKFTNFSFAFSTGAELDTISVSGKITDYFKNKVLKGATVALYRADDTTDIDKHKPYYFAKTDTAGKYIIKNIKQGKYRIYAISEPKPDMKYNNPDDMIGFRNDTLDLTFPQKNINFGLVRYDTRKIQIKNIKVNRQVVDLRLNKVPLAYGIEFQDKKYDTLIYHAQNEDFITFFNKNKDVTDTVFAKLTVEDSAHVKIDTLIKFKFEKAEKLRKIPFTNKISPVPNERLEAGKPFEVKIGFSKPVLQANFDSAYYVLDKDSTEYPLRDFSANANLTEFSKHMNVKYEDKITLTFPKGCFISVEGDTLAEVKSEYLLAKPADFGIIGGIVHGRGENYIVQIIDDLNKVEKEHVGGKNFRFEFLKPGKKIIRVITDANGNGRWDPGSFKDRIQPEKVTFYKSEIALKANWEMLDFVIDTESDPKVE